MAKICAHLETETLVSLSLVSGFSSFAMDTLCARDAHNPDGSRALTWAAKHGELNTLKRSLRFQNPESINRLFHVGPNSIEVPRTALHAAAERGQQRMVEELLIARANVDVKDGDGLTPYCRAIDMLDADIMTVLWDHGSDDKASADRGHRGDPFVILYHAVFRECVGTLGLRAAKEDLDEKVADCLRIILDRGPVNVRQDFQDVLYHNCLLYDLVDTVDVLWKYGANVDVAPRNELIKLMHDFKTSGFPRECFPFQTWEFVLKNLDTVEPGIIEGIRIEMDDLIDESPNVFRLKDLLSYWD